RAPTPFADRENGSPSGPSRSRTTSPTPTATTRTRHRCLTRKRLPPGCRAPISGGPRLSSRTIWKLFEHGWPPVPDERRTWKLVSFAQRFEEWVERESPGQDLNIHVGLSIFTRADDPYRGARRAEDFENLWFIPLPGARNK